MNDDNPLFRWKAVPLWLKTLLTVSLTVLALALVNAVPSGEVALSPHRPIDLQSRIQIDGKPMSQLNGKLFIVGVREQEVSVLQKLLLRFDDEVNFEPESRDPENLRQRAGEQEIASSKKVGAAAAFTLLGQRVTYRGSGVSVGAIDATSPAKGKLQVGDVIVKANGVNTYTALELTRIIGRLPVGSSVRLGVRRDQRPMVIQLRTVTPRFDDNLHRSVIRIGVTTKQLDIQIPHEVVINTGEVLGPSAGLGFALALYDAQSQNDMLRGQHVVATGELSLDGGIHAVGGIRQKVIAAHNSRADIIVVPYANEPAARRASEEVCDGAKSCVKVVGARSVEEAVRELSQL